MFIEIDGNLLDLDTDNVKVTTPSYRVVHALIKNSDYSLLRVAEIMGERNGKPIAPQNISNKMRKDTLRVSELLEIVDICGYNIAFYSDRDTLSKRHENKKAVTISIPDDENNNKPSPAKSFDEKSQEGLTYLMSVNFRAVLLAGIRCEEAYDWLAPQITNDITYPQELLLYCQAREKFDIIFMVVPHS